MDEPTRRAWSSPELIVLVRSGPEEAVLLSCKTMAPAKGPGGAQDSCSLAFKCEQPCGLDFSS